MMDDMRDEYDFSNGERGKYAKRIAGRPISTPTTRGETPPTGTVLIVQIDEQTFRWKLKSAAGELLATSDQTYPSLDACRDAVEVLVQSMSHPATIITDAA